MAKRELFRIPVFGFLLKMWGAFPVDRNRADRGTIKKALELLRRGKVLCIFPEGTRSKTGALLPPSGGAAYIAVKSRAPVCPVAVICNRQGVLQLYRKYTLRIGETLRFNHGNGKNFENIAEQVMGRVQALLDS